jgi:hypothetical protein
VADVKCQRPEDRSFVSGVGVQVSAQPLARKKRQARSNWNFHYGQDQQDGQNIAALNQENPDNPV